MRVLAVLIAAALLLYPLLVYMGGRWLEPRYLGLIALSLFLLRGVMVSRSKLMRLALLASGVLLAFLLWWLNSATLLLLVPAFINAAMAVVFGYSLVNPPTIPARIARRFEGELTPRVERYTTQVTRLWLALFCFNGTVAAITALGASRELWLLYNGVIAYVLVGLLFAGEYSYRQFVIKKHNAL